MLARRKIGSLRVIVSLLGWQFGTRMVSPLIVPCLLRSRSGVSTQLRREHGDSLLIRITWRRTYWTMRLLSLSIIFIFPVICYTGRRQLARIILLSLLELTTRVALIIRTTLTQTSGVLERDLPRYLRKDKIGRIQFPVTPLSY